MSSRGVTCCTITHQYNQWANTAKLFGSGNGNQTLVMLPLDVVRTLAPLILLGKAREGGVFPGPWLLRLSVPMSFLPAKDECVDGAVMGALI